MKYVVALGGNLGNPEVSFATACSQIEEGIGKILARSTLIRTPPLALDGQLASQQADYLNAVIVLSSHLNPSQLLEALLNIERALGRDRETETLRWGPRVIDLDIIAAEDLVILQEGLCIPHPEMHKRDFVLFPMEELWPDWRHPILAKTIAEMAEDIRESSRYL